MPKRNAWHGSTVRIDRFDLSRSTDGGLHFGGRDQAKMRNSVFLHEVEIDLGRTRRVRDTGGEWRSKIAAAKSAGFNSITYLNRYEGLSTERIEALAESALLSQIDEMTDAEFRRHVPEAEDSFIVFDPDRVHLIAVTPRREIEQKEEHVVQDRRPFYSTCVGWPPNRILAKEFLDSNGEEISRKSFLELVDREVMKDIEEELGYTRDPRHGLTMANDPCVSYYREPSAGIPYFVQSATEHCFATSDEIDRLEDRVAEEDMLEAVASDDPSPSP